MTRQSTFTLTDAQIKALPTTAVVLLPAQGENLIVIPILATLVGDGFTANPYTNLDETSLSFSFRYEAADNPGTGLGFSVSDAGVFPDNFLTKDTLARAFNASGSYNTSPPTPEALANVGIDLKVNNQAAGNFTGGNAANTMQIVMLYLLLNLQTGQFV